MSAASSADARGMTPGSLNEVRKRAIMTKTYKMPPTIGMAGVMVCARNGQLRKLKLIQTRTKKDPTEKNSLKGKK